MGTIGEVARFFDFKTVEKADELLTVLNHSTISASIDGVNKYECSVMDYVWNSIEFQLQSFGYSQDNILKIREQLTAHESEFSIMERLANLPFYIDTLDIPEDDRQKIRNAINSGTWKTEASKKSTLSLLHLLVADAISKRHYVHLAVFSDASFLPVSESSLITMPNECLRKLNTTAHIKISITGLLADLLGENRNAEISTALGFFRPDEEKILELIRSQNYTAITIKFSRKKIDSLELTREVDTQKRIVDILAENKYQSLTVTRHDGKTVKLTNTIKMKL